MLFPKKVLLQLQRILKKSVKLIISFPKKVLT